MTTKLIYPIIVLIVALLLQSCANDNKKTPQQTPVTSNTPTASEPTPADNPQALKESTVNKPAEAIRENKTNRLGAVPTGKDAELNSTIPAPPMISSPQKNRSTAAGPPGYITRQNAILQAEPSQNAAQISTLKQYEIVYILETIMTNEQGQLTDLPTWYKVERENKQRGWVVAKSVNAGAGG